MFQLICILPDHFLAVCILPEICRFTGTYDYLLFQKFSIYHHHHHLYLFSGDYHLSIVYVYLCDDDDCICVYFPGVPV